MSRIRQNSWHIIEYLRLNFQIGFMTPNIDVLKRLLKNCLRGSTIILKPLSNMVCMLPMNVLVPLQPELSDMMDDTVWTKPSLRHIQLSVIQHCRKSGIYLNSAQAPGVSEVLNEPEPCQAVSYYPPLEFNSRKSSDTNKNNSDNIRNKSNNNYSCISISNSISSNSANSNIDSTQISCITTKNLQTSTLVEAVNIQSERSGHEVQGSYHMKIKDDDGEPVQGVMTDSAAPAMLELLPPSPKSLPPSTSTEPLDSHNQLRQPKSKTIVLISPGQSNKQGTTGIERKCLQQSVVRNLSHLQPSIELTCTSDTKDKTLKNTVLRNDTHDLKGLLLTPESIRSVNPGCRNTKRGQDSGTNNSLLEPKSLDSLYYCDSDITGQGAPSDPLSTNQMYSESPCKEISFLKKPAQKLSKVSVKERKLRGVEVPQFHVTKRIDSRFPKTSNYVGNGDQNINQALELDLPPFDAITYMDAEDNSDFGNLQRFSQESDFKTSSSVTVPLQDEQLGNHPRTRNLRCQQTNRSWRAQQNYEQSRLSPQFSHMSSLNCNTQQNQR